MSKTPTLKQKVGFETSKTCTLKQKVRQKHVPFGRKCEPSFHMFDPFLKEQNPPAARAAPGRRCILFLQVSFAGANAHRFRRLIKAPPQPASRRPSWPPNRAAGQPACAPPVGWAGKVSESVRFRIKINKIPANDHLVGSPKPNQPASQPASQRAIHHVLPCRMGRKCVRIGTFSYQNQYNSG